MNEIAVAHMGMDIYIENEDFSHPPVTRPVTYDFVKFVPSNPPSLPQTNTPSLHKKWGKVILRPLFQKIPSRQKTPRLTCSPCLLLVSVR